MDVHVKNNRYQILQFKQITKQIITENNMKQVNRIIKNQISTTSNQEEWNNIIKSLKTSAEKNLEYNHKEKKKQIPKHSAPVIDSERCQHQIKLHQRRIKKKLLKKAEVGQ